MGKLFLPPGVYRFYVDSGAYPEEVSWQIMAACGEEGGCSNPPVFQGGVSDTATIGVSRGHGEPAQAVYALELLDSFGDGWDGAYYHVVDAESFAVVNSGTLHDHGSRTEYLVLPPGVYSFFVDPEGQFPEELSWTITACEREGDCSSQPSFGGGANDTVAIAVVRGSTAWCDAQADEAWAIHHCHDLFLGTSHCNGADLTMVGDTCGMSGCQVAVGTDMVNKTCEQYCEMHGLSCAGSWPADDFSCMTAAVFELHLIDTYGDGWNGAYFRVATADGENISSGTLTDGYNRTEYLALPPGEFHFTVDPEGLYPEEVRWEIMACAREGDCSGEPLFQGNASETATLRGGAMTDEKNRGGCGTPIESEHAICRCQGYAYSQHSKDEQAHMRQEKKVKARECLKVADDFEACVQGFGGSEVFPAENRAELMHMAGSLQCTRLDESIIDRIFDHTGLEVELC